MITSLAKQNSCVDVVAPPSKRQPRPGAVSYRGLVWSVGQEDPLVALVVGRVQPVENVAGHLVLQQGQHQGIKLLVPLLGGPLGGAQGQLLWRTKTMFSGARFQVVVDVFFSRCTAATEGQRFTIFDDDLQDSVLIAASGAGKDFLQVIPS